MGDELGLRNHYDFADDPEHADDNRWVHRPPMPWSLVDRRHDPNALEHRVWHGLRHAIAVRASLPSMDASVETEVMDPVNPAVLVFVRRFPTQTLVGVYNVTPDPQKLPRWVIPLGNWATDALNGGTPLTDGDLTLRGLPGPLAGAGGLSPVSDLRGEAIDVIRATLTSLEVTWRESGPGLFSVTLPGTHKLSTECALEVGEYAVGVRAFVARRPDENQRQFTPGCWSATCVRTASRSAWTPSATST